MIKSITMEEDSINSDILHTFCCKLPRKKHRIWLYMLVPSALCFTLHIVSILVDFSLACQLAWTDKRLKTGVTTFILIYVPVVFTMVLKPPQLPKIVTFTGVAGWLLQELVNTVMSPVYVSLRLLKRLHWTIKVVRSQKSYEEILIEYEVTLSKEVHSYLFLQAFLQCAPQAILQMHLLILKVVTNTHTEYLQGASILMALITMAFCTASFHRYEAQVEGGRPSVLLLNPAENKNGTYSETSMSLLPIRYCLRGKIIALEMDCPLGKVVAFFSWFFLIFGRTLCLVISNETNPDVTIITLIVHYSTMLLYLFSSQHTAVRDMPSRLFNASLSIMALVEVSVRFHKIPLLYTLFFICIIVEDTFLMILFFVYSYSNCSFGDLDCKYIGVYAYLIINSHVIGIILFGIYLSRLRPRKKSLMTSLSTTSIVTS